MQTLYIDFSYWQSFKKLLDWCNLWKKIYFRSCTVWSDLGHAGLESKGKYPQDRRTCSSESLLDQELCLQDQSQYEKRLKSKWETQFYQIFYFNKHREKIYFCCFIGDTPIIENPLLTQTLRLNIISFKSKILN